MKKKNSVKVLASDSVLSFSINVTEKIDSKYIDDFIRTSIDTQNIQINKNSSFYYKFLETSSSYEIIVFDKTHKNLVLEPFILLGYYDDFISNNSIDVFLTNKFFVLFIDKKFQLFKNISDVSEEDIKVYVSQTYNLQVDNIIKIDKDKLESIKKNYFNYYHPKVTYKYISAKKIIRLKYFKYFFL